MKIINAMFFRLAISIALCGVTGGALAQTKAAAVVKGSGCVETGVEAGCLVLTNAADKKTYNLMFGSGKKATAGMAISFEGTVHSGPTICMQGTAVNVTKWNQTKMACPQKPGNNK